MPLSSNKWVLYTHSIYADELYLAADMVQSPDVREAIGFATAREAYDFAKKLAPHLDDWRVGLRG